MELWNIPVYGAIDSLMSWVAGKLGASLGGRFGRGHLFGLAFGIDITLMTALLLWRPYPTSLIPFFWVSMLYGCSDAIFQTQLYTMYGVLFNDNTDAAFANFRFWEALGFCIAYGYQSFLETRIKCYIMLSVILISLVGYVICEYTVSQTEIEQKAEKLPLQESSRVNLAFAVEDSEKASAKFKKSLSRNSSGSNSRAFHTKTRIRKQGRHISSHGRQSQNRHRSVSDPSEPYVPHKFSVIEEEPEEP